MLRNNEEDDSSSSDSDTLIGDSPTATNTELLYKAIAEDDILQVSYYLTLEPVLEPTRNKPSPLWLAIHKSTPEIVDVLIRGGCSITETQRPSDYYLNSDNALYNYHGDSKSFSDYNGYTFHTKMTLVHWAVLNKSYHKVRALLAHGASPNWVDDRDNSVLQYAVESGNVRIAEELIKQGANINEPLAKHPGNMVIHEAVSYGNIPMVKMLLSYGADPRAVNWEGQTLLHVLAISKREEKPELVKILIDAGSPIEYRFQDEYTPLYLAVELKLIETTRVLLDHNADPNTTTSKSAFPLLLASRRRCPELIELLLEFGAKIDQKIFTGQTALHVACILGHEDIVELLIRFGADLNATDNCGKTPLHAAIEKRRKSIARLILKNGAEVDPRDGSNYTPLHVAAEMGLEQLVQLLVEFEADVHALGGNGENALHFASKAERKSLVLAERLIDVGVSVMHQDNWGYTPLHKACRNYKESLVSILADFCFQNYFLVKISKTISHFR